MTAKQKPSLAELKVGVFVVVACAILAMAIFAIGSQVGLFQEQFWAITYLSNVSGLKPGDIVLLGGVEVGNVASVEISDPASLPATVQNVRIGREIDRLATELEKAQEETRTAREALQTLETEYREAIDQSGESSPQARQLLEKVNEADELFSSQEDNLERLRRDLDRAQSRLQNIEVQMRINQEYKSWIKADSSISLGSIGLLGDKYIEISLGRTSATPEIVRREIKGWIGTTTRELLLVTGTQQASFGELITGANDILANFETLSRQVHDIMTSFGSGEGTIGRFITDPSFYNNLNNAVERFDKTVDGIAQLVSNMTTGEGTIAKLVQRDEVHERLVSAIERIDKVLAKVDSGEGALGKFVNDPSVYDRSNDLVAEIDKIMERINAGEGTLGRLSTEDKLYVSLRETTEELSAILKDIEEGKGTLGRLAKDDQLYRNINELSTELVKLIYDFRQNPKKFLTIKFELF